MSAQVTARARRCPAESIEASYIASKAARWDNMRVKAFMRNRWIRSYLDLGYAKFILLLPTNQYRNLLVSPQVWHSVGEVEDMRRDVADLVTKV